MIISFEVSRDSEWIRGRTFRLTGSIENLIAEFLTDWLQLPPNWRKP